MADNCRDVHLVNFTVEAVHERPEQAEGLLLMGERFILNQVTIIGSGDALQANGSVYLADCRIVGDGDNILGRGPGFYERVEMVTTGGPHMWIRNTDANHGNVFVDSIFRTEGDAEAVIARAPQNKGNGYPFCEAVLLNCELEGISPEGWGAVGEDAANIHYWEFNSTNLADGQPADVSRRAPHSRQLTMESDAERIAQYRDPSFVLGGWNPEMAPLILRQPEDESASPGQVVTLQARVAAVPEAEFQWWKDGEPLGGATAPELHFGRIEKRDAGDYVFSAENEAGRAMSRTAKLNVK